MLTCALCLLGQGCFSRPTATTQIPQVVGEPSPEGTVAFTNGFGTLAGPVPVPEREKSAPMVFDVELPSFPTDVTVLREWSPAPDDTLLRNITNALGVPSGALGQRPNGTDLRVSWSDDRGYAWNYGVVAANAVGFARAGMTPRAPTDEVNAIEQSRAFLLAHGADMTGWGIPFVDGSRVVFAASRDRQSVVDDAGRPVPEAVIEVTDNGTPARGWFVIPRQMDRSNYPALNASDIQKRLRSGGTNIAGIAGGGVVTISRFALGLYRYRITQDAVIRTYYLPALLAEGTVTRTGGFKTPYATAVPLVHDDAFLR